MSHRFSRSAYAWFGIAGIVFLVAISLTTRITWVAGVRTGGYTQYLGILVPVDTADDADDSFAVLFTESRSNGTAVATFSMPNDDVTVLLVSGLASEHACSIPPFPGLSEKRKEVPVRHVDWLVNLPDLYAVTIRAHTANLIDCEIQAPSREVSFTSRDLRIEYASDVLVAAEANKDVEPLRQAFLASVGRGVLQGISQLKFDVHADGADGMRFDGGAETSDDLFGGTWRSLRNGEFMSVAWNDIYRQQTRDILLIVIGTLIGIGVTVLIEGLRPMVENLSRERSPQQKNKPPPPAPPTAGS